jgi:hypothetical protein
MSDGELGIVHTPAQFELMQQKSWEFTVLKWAEC